MIYRALARVVAALHLLFVLFVVLGGLLTMRWPALVWIHVPAVVWAVATLAFDLGCPLTLLEKFFLRKDGSEPYREGFLQHHVFRPLVSSEPSHRVYVLLGVGVLVLVIVVYAIAFTSRTGALR
ncbi:MAG: DUF2784 domain-containing protein [Gemmatimonadaceae bacterium]